jgi:hypothetical protein
LVLRVVVLGRVGARGAQDDNQIVRGGFVAETNGEFSVVIDCILAVAEDFPEKPRWLFAYGRAAGSWRAFSAHPNDKS